MKKYVIIFSFCSIQMLVGQKSDPKCCTQMVGKLDSIMIKLDQMGIQSKTGKASDSLKIVRLNDTVTQNTNRIKSLDLQVKKLQEQAKADFNREKSILEEEISAILNQSIALSESLVRSLEIRAIRYSPANQEQLNKYLIAYKAIKTGYSILDKVIVPAEVRAKLEELSRIKLDEKVYVGLEEDRNKLTEYLEQYCDLTNSLAKYIEDSKVLQIEATRIEFLSNVEFEFENYPYLSEVLKSAKKDRLLIVDKVTCP